MSTTATETDETTGTETEGTEVEGTETATVEGVDTTETDGEDTDAGKQDLGTAGKQALTRMKAERKAANDRARKAEQELATERAKAEGREAEHQASLEAQKVRDEALAVANTRILKAEIRAAAAQRLADPQDALRFIDLSEFEVDSDGNVDADAIATAIADLIEKKPYLAAQGKRFEGSADAGVRNGAQKASQLTEADVKRMYAAGQTDEINAAREAGRLDKMLGRKT